MKWKKFGVPRAGCAATGEIKLLNYLCCKHHYSYLVFGLWNIVSVVVAKNNVKFS